MANERSQVVHVRDNSEDSLNQLFQVIKQDPQSVAQNNSSMRARKLPASFFNPPNRPHPSHSRENSHDSNQFSRVSQQLTNHARSHSSPAHFSSSSPLSVPNPHHGKQQSMDILLDDPGWNPDHRQLQNFHPQFSQQQQQAQWTINNHKSNPHLTASPQPGSTPVTLSPNQSLSSLSPPQPQIQSQSIIEQMLMPVPSGWEISITRDDEIYFINHMNKTTSWFHPNIPKQQQGPGPIKLAQLPPHYRDLINQRIIQSQAALQQQQQLPPVSCIPAAATNGVAANMMAAAAVTNQQQQQQQQQQQLGRMLVTSPQQQQQQHPQQQQVTGAAYIQAQLQALHMEKQKLRQKEEEIERREKLLVQRNFANPSQNASALSNSAAATNAAAAAQMVAGAVAAHNGLQQQQQLGIIDENNPSTNQTRRNDAQENVLNDLMLPGAVVRGDQLHANAMQVQSSGVDPFLGQGQNIDSHARQNSSDSGLGGMSQNYSLPRTPDGLLSNVDEMDSTSMDGGRLQPKQQQQQHQQQQQQQQQQLPGSDFSMNDMQGMSMDLTGSGVEAMEGADDLIPSLQSDALTNDMLQDMDPNSVLTWL